VPWLRRLSNLLRPRRIEDDIRRELAFHLAERADQLRSEGLSDEDARRRARVQFGNVSVLAERTRDMDGAPAVEAWLRDVRYAVRSLRRTPGFSLAVLLTLALGMGANSAVFSTLDAILLRPLPFPDGNRLMELRQQVESAAETHIAPVRLEDWQRMNTSFTAITGYYTEDISETSREFPERIREALVAPRFLEVWGIEPAIGRSFTLDDHRIGSAPAILVSHRYWRDRLAGDPNVLNRTVRIGSASIRIVGVMPASFLFPDRSVDLWSPVPLDATFTQSRRATWYVGVGRLKDGVTVGQARANLAAVQVQLGQTYGDVDAGIQVSITPLKDSAVHDVRRSLWLLFAGVSVFLLITCTNVASLLLSRAAYRQHELAVRVSLGASRLTVARQILIETLVLSIAGAAIGLGVAFGAIRLLRTVAAGLPRMDEISIDVRIMAYTFATAVVVALFCALLPAMRSARHRHGVGVNDGGRALISTRYAVQWLLVGAQVTLSVTLLAGAVLLARSLQELWRTDSGFNLQHVLAFRVSGTWAESVNQERLRTRIDGTIDKLHSLPGVEGAATTGWSLPGVPTQFESPVELVEARNAQDRKLIAEVRSVSAEYFSVMQIPLVAGEPCRRRTGVAREVMVNRTFAERYLTGRAPSPVGLHLVPFANGGQSVIAGVVADARERGLDREPGPIVYSCFSAPNPTPYFLIRTRVDPALMANQVRFAMKELDPNRAVYELDMLQERVEGAFAQNRFRAILLVLFAGAALVLACVGVYGTLSYVVSVRRREVALRLALGAGQSAVLRQFLFESLRIVGAATVCGLGLTIAATRLFATMLYGVSPHDPLILAAVAAVIVAVSTAAAMIPAYRASRVDVMLNLRET
jgi:putative ABC transport system permease protein